MKCTYYCFLVPKKINHILQASITEWIRNSVFRRSSDRTALLLSNLNVQSLKSAMQYFVLQNSIEMITTQFQNHEKLNIKLRQSLVEFGFGSLKSISMLNLQLQTCGDPVKLKLSSNHVRETQHSNKICSDLFVNFIILLFSFIL